MAKERLQKVIAHAGVASRRAAEGLILAGKVKVNGQVVTELGTKVDGNDEVMVNGEPVEQEQHEYYLLDKPRGVISSAHGGRYLKKRRGANAGLPGGAPRLRHHRPLGDD